MALSIKQLSELQIGQQVGVAYAGGWSVQSQGLYIVKDINKVRIVLVRESDGHQRTFSSRTGIEKGSDRYYSAFIESVAVQVERAKVNEHRRAVDKAWADVEQAAKQKNHAAVTAALEVVKQITLG